MLCLDDDSMRCVPLKIVNLHINVRVSLFAIFLDNCFTYVYRVKTMFLNLFLCLIVLASSR